MENTKEKAHWWGVGRVHQDGLGVSAISKKRIHEGKREGGKIGGSFWGESALNRIGTLLEGEEVKIFEGRRVTRKRPKVLPSENKGNFFLASRER